MSESNFQNNSTEVLLYIRDNLLSGLERIGESVDAGTFETSKKEGAAPPSQGGHLTLSLLLEVEDELESRVRGFQRSVDPSLIVKTL